ncbi:photosystem II D1 precursor processing protein PSB27-H2, chloroplastic [Malania oleifera]|uniref:photosystem II D1 precursor processing protein PSB27-H2, chloroplastic n=1 Tax=Malania oleifera TaxID=397392 RepID=UPI0025ADED7B|nr:photosystem II D1 precursor processing protein PSB27-H2, chloroplastic [Malania oleifera]XP_057959975.1 photosystem II D1 precursor processing protein PSB27-H2, chloroplastic [Malania oleifera]
MRMAVLLAVQRYPPIFSCPLGKFLKPITADELQSRSYVVLPFQETHSSRRQLCSGISLVAFLAFNCSLTPLPLLAEDELKGQEDRDSGIIGAINSLFDPNEKTKSGKVLPKAYLRSAREVVKTLRESLKEDPKDISKFRQTADAAKESIREYLSNWKGQQTVASEESYLVLEKAFRSLASFYSKAGPFAPLPEEVKSEILNDLNTAEESL